MSLINLMHGDCIEKMREIEDHSIDFCLTDPPYGTTSCKWDSVIPFKPMWAELKRIMKQNGAICLFGSEPFSSNLRMSNIKKFRYDWIWHKNMSGSFVLAKKQPMKYHEIISVFYEKQPSYYPQFQEYSGSVKNKFKHLEKVNIDNLVKSHNEIQNIKILSTQYDFNRGKYPESVQFFKSEGNANGNRLHPSQKPIPLLEYLIKTYTLEAETVLDFTMGSGSTGLACKNLNRNFVGIESDSEYFEVAKKRLESHV